MIHRQHLLREAEDLRGWNPPASPLMAWSRCLQVRVIQGDWLAPHETVKYGSPTNMQTTWTLVDTRVECTLTHGNAPKHRGQETRT
jgi:hypothetical protein